MCDAQPESASSGWIPSPWPEIVAFRHTPCGKWSGWFTNTLTSCWSNTMSTIHQDTEAMATRAWTEGRIIYLELTDQRIIGFPANRFRRLKEASEAELAEVRLEVGGTALRWESLDEDISVKGVVAGRFQLPPAP